MNARQIIGSVIRVATSVLCAGVFYLGWMAVFILVLKAGASAARTVGWLSIPVVTGAGFAAGIVLAERLTGRRTGKFLHILPWPLIGCAIGAGAVFRFGPMLIVFGMFFVGTASVVLREFRLAHTHLTCESLPCHHPSRHC